MAATMTKAERLATHAVREGVARRGGSYPEYALEHEWATSNLPQTRAAFRAVVRAAQALPGYQGEMELAAALLHPYAGTRIGLRGQRELNLAGIHDAADRAAARRMADIWFPPRPRKKARHTCARCGRPAMSRANLGWACDDHYDTLS